MGTSDIAGAGGAGVGGDTNTGGATGAGGGASMADATGSAGALGAAPGVWYAYAVVRLVPCVERGEFVNVGVVLFARERRYLAARIELDVERLRALDPEADVALIERHLRAFVAVGAGADAGGPLAALPPSERFHWLTAPRSTVIQTSPIHVGTCADPAAALDELLDAFVRPPRHRASDPTAT